MAWGKNGTPSTLTGTASAITISDLTAKKFNLFLKDCIKTASLAYDTTFNNDTGSLYSRRISYSGGADATSVSRANCGDDTATDTQPEFHIMYSCWISGEEKLCIDFGVEGLAVGAGSAPTRSECVAKYVPSTLTNTCNRIDEVVNTSTLAVGSNISAIGTD